MTPSRSTRGAAALARAAVLAGALAGAACTGPPWFMGTPLDGRASVSPTRKNPSWKGLEAEAATAQTKRQTALELPPLIALDDLARLEPSYRARLLTLLERRAADFHALDRAVPESRDLERLSRLAPARGAGLLGERAAAARAAGDAWLAVGALDEARAAYVRALELGAGGMDFRMRALGGHPPPGSTTLAELRVAIEALPLRAVPPFALVYVTHGGRDRATLARSLAAARQEKLEGLMVRVRAAEAARVASEAARAGAGAGAAPDAGASPDASPADAEGDDAGVFADAAPADALLEAPAPMPIPADLEAWMLGGATVSARLLPLVAAHPEILDDVARAVFWVDLMLREDESSPRVLELAALVFGHAARLGGTERMLMELAYASPDRAEGLARGAVIWERLGRGREACAQWIRAARWRDDAEDPLWRQAVSCARRDPGAGNWRDIRSYVLTRARPDRRAALAAELDAP